MNTKDYFDWDENGFDEEHKNRSLPPEYLYYGTTHHQYEQIQRSGYISHMEKPKIQLTTDIPLEFPWYDQLLYRLLQAMTSSLNVSKDVSCRTAIADCE